MTAVKQIKAELPHTDPIMKRTCMLIAAGSQARGHSINGYLVRQSGVNYTTIRNWQSGKTRRPQAATMRAVLRVLGYDLAIIKQSWKK